MEDIILSEDKIYDMCSNCGKFSIDTEICYHNHFILCDDCRNEDYLEEINVFEYQCPLCLNKKDDLPLLFKDCVVPRTLKIVAQETGNTEYLAERLNSIFGGYVDVCPKDDLVKSACKY